MLAACSGPKPDPQPGADLNFAVNGQLPLRVAHIDVIEDYVPVNAPPHVEGTFTVPPDQAIRRWVADRLRATGGEFDLTINITNADVIETPLPTEGGLVGAFTNEQNRQWTAHLSANFNLRSAVTGRLVSTTGFHIEHLITTLERQKPIEIRENQARLIREAMNDFDRAATMTLKQDMPQIASAP